MPDTDTTISIKIGTMTIARTYPHDDLIWGLPDEKRMRKVVADCQKDLLIEADRLSNTPYTIRG